jgi:hypothetical protein
LRPLTSCGFLPDVCRRLVFSQADMDGVPQEIVGGPGQISDLDNQLRLDPMDALQPS